MQVIKPLYLTSKKDLLFVKNLRKTDIIIKAITGSYCHICFMVCTVL